MKHGLLVYQESNSIWRNGTNYLPSTVNIGDYIQSLAARQFLPSVDAFVNREGIRDYSGEAVKLIMNGWWRIFDGNETVNPKITPLYISYHIAVPEELTATTFTDLKKHEPIGCRDMATCRLLEQHDIKAYFSGCLTLTLGRKYRVSDDQRGREVILSDLHSHFLNPPRIKFFDFFKKNTHSGKLRRIGQKELHNMISTLISDVSPDEIVQLKHSLPIREESHEKRFEIAEEYLRRYAKARLVITSRIHSALPCLALGTPVLLVFHRYDALRYEGLIDLLNYIGLRDEKPTWKYTAERIKSIENDQEMILLINSESYRKYSETLTKSVLSFLEST